ncbi:MAG: anaerobic glycerol-3-phosphate dehydrogenase subunit GlpB [Solirubrobacteraceae bacterium]
MSATSADLDGPLHYDAVVIGAGTAGLTAAIRLAQAGADVCVLAKGVGSTHLAPATIDVLGRLEGDELVSGPGAALKRLIAARPDHPYALIGAAVVAESLRWFAEMVAAAPPRGYEYVGGLERNLMLPTAIGVLRPSALVPTTMAAGEAGGLHRVAIAGTPALRDFHPSMCAANLREVGIEARAVRLALELERADTSALGVARRFDDPTWRAAFCARLSAALGAEDHVGLPAILGLHDPAAVLADVERRLGRPVFEIPTLPPSVPGMRLYEILRSALRAAGGRLVIGAEVVSGDRCGDRIESVATRAAGREARYAAPWFVLASGGLASGGIELDSHWTAHERVLGLRLCGVPALGEPRFVPDFFAEQPLGRAGVAVDAQLRAEGTVNVLVAGAALPGQAPWREGCGEGVAIASGYRAAQVLALKSGAARADAADTAPAVPRVNTAEAA